ncbi:helix-turn-helix transcriptional regulator [Microbacterium sp. 1.5R]|uniref:helix-turn-helix domain-containing protein n=1 Tax=Microbacterium sp. 1.5R TaxID=1916917 RepID=UPI0011A710E7|nr:helix-turn-helix transcriptional regulator [Microbacterium sp. 1.5R]
MRSARSRPEAEASGIIIVLEDLLSAGVGCAPHVAAELFDRLGGDGIAVTQTVLLLEPAQRRGLSPLPGVLPLVPALESDFVDVQLDLREREEAVCAVLDADAPFGVDHRAPGADRVDDHRTGMDGRSTGGGAGGSDARAATWVLATSTPDQIASAHRALSAHHDGLGERTEAAWHRVCGVDDPGDAAIAEVLRAARTRRSARDSRRGLRFAGAAAAHATGSARREAFLAAGIAAMGSGYAAEAVAWLGGLFDSGPEDAGLPGLAALLVAETHLRGAVPELDAASFRPGSPDPAAWYAYARAAALAAALSAERGERAAAREWLAALRFATAKAGAERELRDPVVSLTWLLLGESEPDDVLGTGLLTGVVPGALRAAAEGDIDAGLRLLAAGDYHSSTQPDPFVEGFEHSPLVDAYRAVAEALLLLWRGDVGAARDHLHRAALDLPVALPFAGLGVVLSRRLDIAVLGRPGPVARSLTVSLPAPPRIDQLIDRALEAHLDGRADEAASLVRLWIDRGAPQPVIGVPGLDEITIVGMDGDSVPPHSVETPDMALGRLLRMRASTSPQNIWLDEMSQMEEAARSIRSPFERGRVSAAFGLRAIIHDDNRAGRRHLRTALALFEESGARAWATHAAERLRLLDRAADRDDELGDAVAAIRRRWEPILTRRELEIAMAAVGGSSNREIAASFTVSVRTVEVHLGRVFAKLGVRSRVELMLLALRSARHG